MDDNMNNDNEEGHDDEDDNEEGHDDEDDNEDAIEMDESIDSNEEDFLDMDINYLQENWLRKKNCIKYPNSTEYLSNIA